MEWWSYPCLAWQGQTVGLLTQRLADARSAIAAELQDAATERALPILAKKKSRRKNERRVAEKEGERMWKVKDELDEE